MPVITTDEFMNRIRTLVGDDTSDETLATIQDFSDTLNSFGDSANEIARLNSQLTEQDEAWRKKYRDAFFHGPEEREPDNPHDDGPKKLTFESLFTTKE